MEYEKTRSICKKIVSKMKLGRALTEYEEVYVNKWINKFEYSFDIIELALKKTIKTANPNIKYIDAILSAWDGKGLRTKEQIIEFDINYANSKKAGFEKDTGKSSVKNKGLSSKDNFEQREYEDEFLESLYKNI
jgi:DnaD/phage-associated family protein